MKSIKELKEELDEILAQRTLASLTWISRTDYSNMQKDDKLQVGTTYLMWRE